MCYQRHTYWTCFFGPMWKPNKAATREVGSLFSFTRTHAKAASFAMNIFTLAFLAIPIALIAYREFSRRKISLWLIFFAYVVIGWLLWDLSVWWYFAGLDDLIKSTPHPSPELLESRQSDGAALVFGWYFGWIFAAIYFLFCLVFVLIIRDIVETLFRKQVET